MWLQGEAGGLGGDHAAEVELAASGIGRETQGELEWTVHTERDAGLMYSIGVVLRIRRDAGVGESRLPSARMRSVQWTTAQPPSWKTSTDSAGLAARMPTAARISAGGAASVSADDGHRKKRTPPQ